MLKDDTVVSESGITIIKKKYYCENCTLYYNYEDAKKYNFRCPGCDNHDADYCDTDGMILKPIDEPLINLIREINNLGITTEYCCSGHLDLVEGKALSISEPYLVFYVEDYNMIPFLLDHEPNGFSYTIDNTCTRDGEYRISLHPTKHIWFDSFVVINYELLIYTKEDWMDKVDEDRFCKDFNTYIAPYFKSLIKSLYDWLYYIKLFNEVTNNKVYSIGPLKLDEPNEATDKSTLQSKADSEYIKIPESLPLPINTSLSSEEKKDVADLYNVYDTNQDVKEK